MTTGKTIAFTRQTLVGKVMCLLLNSLISLQTVYSEVFSFGIAFSIVHLIKKIFFDCAGSLSSCSKQGWYTVVHGAPHCVGLSCCGTQAVGAQVQSLWHMDPRACRLQ